MPGARWAWDHKTHTLSHPCPQPGRAPLPLCSRQGSHAPAPTLTSTHLPFCLLQADQAPPFSPKTPKELPPHGQELMGKERREGKRVLGRTRPLSPGPQGELKGPSPLPTVLPGTNGSQADTRLQLNPPYGCFPVRKWANCNISAPAGETDGQEEEAGRDERSHLAAGGRGQGPGEGRQDGVNCSPTGRNSQVKESLRAVPLREVLEAPPAAQACLAGFVLPMKEEPGDHSSVSRNVNHRHLR